MIRNFYIIFKDIESYILGIAVTRRPSVPAPKKRGDFVEVAGRDGALLVTDNTYDLIEIDVEMNFVRDKKYWQETYRRTKNWLIGSGELRFSDDTNWHYKVKTCSITSMSRVDKIGGKFTARFVCEPFLYHNSGDVPMSIEDVKMNPYYLCKPVYYITGNGNCTLTVNGKTVSALISNSVTIDTDKMIAYKEDNRTTLTGDYENLWLENGVNEISITQGFNLKIAPNWRSL